MRIKGAELYQLDLPLSGIKEVFMGNKARGASMVSSIVKITTDNGLTGYGEVSHFPAWSAQHRAAIKEILPELLDWDPLETLRINEHMDYICYDMPWAKSPVDMALWDIQGKACSAPLYKLLGGKFGPDFPVFYCVWPDSMEKMVEHTRQAKKDGYFMYQCKVGTNPLESANFLRGIQKELDATDTLIVDPNTSWSVQGGMKTFDELGDTGIYVEQPCASMESCNRLQQYSGRPLILDESMSDLKSVISAHKTGPGNILALKISRFGGITKAKQARDLAVSLDMSVRVECSAGSDIVTAAMTHLAHSTSSKHLFCGYELSYYHDHHVAEDGPRSVGGKMSAPEKPGLGITVDDTKLGTKEFSL